MRGSSLEEGPLTSNEIGKEEYEFMLGTVVVANDMVRLQKIPAQISFTEQQQDWGTTNSRCLKVSRAHKQHAM